MPELGSGEVIAVDGERLAIRFASGERRFVFELVERHLQVTTEGPPPAKASRAAKPRAAKPRAAKKSSG
jgi:hypothetical protein